MTSENPDRGAYLDLEARYTTFFISCATDYGKIHPLLSPIVREERPMSQTRTWSWLEAASPMWVMLATSVIAGRGVLAAT